MKKAILSIMSFMMIAAIPAQAQQRRNEPVPSFADAVWTGTSAPQDVGFHYYQLIIDGTAMPDPGTVSFFGAGVSMNSRS